MPVDTCTCGARIRWFEMAASGNRMPVEAKPEKRVLLTAEGKGRIVTVYVQHWIACPDAEKHRGQKRLW